MYKKLMWILVLAALATVFCCVSAFAETSGRCGKNGDNLTWTLDDQGKLTISGTGAMKNYSQSDYAPWRGEDVKNAVLEEGVTSIGSFAFSECVNLASVTIPDGVTTIGEHAFDVCRSLTSITIPDSVTTIGPGAFSGCWGLTSISIPKGVTSIGNMAFYCCLNLTSVTIPDSVTSIGAQAFYECSSLTSVTIPKGVTRLESEIYCNCANLASVTLPKGLTVIGNYAFSACSKLMDVYYSGTEAEKESLTIGSDNVCLTNAQWHYAPAIVDSGTCGKDGDNLTWTLDDEGTLTISGTGEMKDYSYFPPWKINGVKRTVMEEGVTSIGDYSFANCSNLTDISIPDSVTSICDYVFKNCNSLKSVHIPDGVTSIGDGAFAGCSARRYANLDSDGAKALGKAGYNFHAIDGNYDLIYLYNDATITGIEISNVDKDAVRVIIPIGVTSIGENAFDRCSSLTDVSIPGSVTSIGHSAFEYCSSLTSVNIPDSVTSIGNVTFYKCSSLTGMIIPDSVTSIGINAFTDCSNLRNVTITNSVISIGSNAFYNCPNLKLTVFSNSQAESYAKSHGISYDYPEFEIAQGILYKYHGNNNDVIIPDNVTSIGSSAFSECSGLTSISIPDGVTSIGSSAFSGCSGLTSISIPDDVTSIGNSAFSGCSGLTSISIPDGITSIGEHAFQSCNSLTSISIPDGVTSIGDYAFQSCSNLTSISIPDGVTSIGDYAFRGCSSLTSVSIPNSVTSIGNRAFEDCNAKLYANIASNSAKALGKAGYTFRLPDANYDLKYLYDNTIIRGLEIVSVDEDAISVNIPEGVTSIDNSVFKNCSSLTSVSIPDSVTTIGFRAFSDCSARRYANMGSEGAKALGKAGYSFRVPGTNYDLEYLYNSTTNTDLEIVSVDEDVVYVDILDGVTIISYSAFSDCSSLTSVAIPGSVTSIDMNGFSSCKKLSAINISNDNTAYASKEGILYTHDMKTLLVCPKGKTSVNIPEGVTSIGNCAFEYCSSLTNVSIPNSVTSIGISAFEYCSSLTNVSIPNSVTNIGIAAFEYCSSLTSVTIPDSVTSIDRSAFADCSSLTNISIPDGTTSISDFSFYKCGSLTSVNIPDGVTIIGDNAFAYCSSLTSITIPDGVTSIGNWAFNGCSAKRYANMDSEGAKALSKAGYGFRLSDTNYDLKYLYDYNNTTITGIALSSVDKDAVSVIVPDIVTSIGNSAFSGCTRLRSIQLPDGITSFTNNSFEDCNAKRYVNIGSETAINLGKAGYGFDVPEANYVLGYLSGDPERLALISVYGNSASLTIPDGVKELEDRVLELFPKVIIPASVTKIHKNSYIPFRFLGLVVYCYEFTYAEEWAKENNCQIIYMDNVIPEDIRTVAFPRESMRLACGDAVELNANVFPMVSPQDIVWSNSNPSVASIEDGELTALKPGTTTITATVGKASASIEIITYNRATGFTIPEEVWFVAKDSVTLPVTDIQPERGELVLTWSSGDASLVRVDENGVVTGNIADKDATITATTDNGISRQCVAHVCYPVTAVAFNEHQVTMREIDRVQLTANVTARTRSLVNKLVTFTSADESVAKVDENGRVAAMGPGTTTITATAANGVSGSVEISVVCAEHTAVTDEAVAPTCTETGLTEGSHCSVCGTVLVEQTVIPANGHTEIETGAVSPTCEGVGYTAGRYCTVCEQYTEGHEEIAALNHDWQTDYSQWFQDGDDWKITATRTCQRQNCDSGENGGPAMETETATATSAVTTPATCVADGVLTWTATFANEAFETKTRTDVIPLDADAHDWNEVTYTWSDDNTSVTAAVTCKNSGDHTLTETANTTSNQTKAPTYFAKGETTYTATFTNALFTEQTRVVDDIAIKEKDAEVKAVEAMIAALKDDSTLSDKDNVNAAREAYQNLTDEQKQQQVSTDILAKLETAEQQVQAAEAAAAKQAADEKAARTVADAIGSLGSSAGLGDKAAVEAARKAYDNLTDDQKKLVPTEVSDKLTAAEASVKAAEEAEAARKAKEEAERKAKEEAERKAKEEAARKAAEEEAARKAAEEEAARKAAEEEAARKAAEEEAARKAAEEEAARKAAEEEAAKQAADESAAKSAADAIQALSDSVGLGDKEAVAAARAAYDALTEDQKKLIPGEVLSKLATAEQQVAAAEEAARTVDISACEIAVKDLAYTGKKVKKPTVTIRYGETQLTEGADYSFTYNTKAKAIGAYKLTVTGMGRYTGSVNTTFKVVPKGTAFSKLTGGDKQITLKWKSQKNITGYQIEYSLKKDFSSSKKVTVKKAKTLTTTIKKLKAGKAYYVRIRTYTTVKKKNYFSAWSKAKAVKTKSSKAKNNSTVPNIEVTLNVGERLELKPLVSLDASDTVLTWTTSDETIATVSQDGVVTAFMPGEVVITATNDEDEQATFVVRVNEAEGVILLDLGEDDMLLDIDDELDEEIITVDGETPVEIEEPAA